MVGRWNVHLTWSYFRGHVYFPGCTSNIRFSLTFPASNSRPATNSPLSAWSTNPSGCPGCARGKVTRRLGLGAWLPSASTWSINPKKTPKILDEWKILDILHIYIYIPNDHRFCWKFGPCFGGKRPKQRLWFQVYISPTLEIARGPLHNHLLLSGSGFSHNVAMKSTPEDAPCDYTTPKFNSKSSPEKLQRASIGKDGLPTINFWGAMLNFGGVYLPLLFPLPLPPFMFLSVWVLVGNVSVWNHYQHQYPPGN